MNQTEGRIEHILVHTGQHYDKDMSENFFSQLEIPRPDINLEVGSGSPSQQTGEIMIKFEKVLLQQKPDLIVVVGDVNSTIACALAAVKLGIRVAHVEAGLRSFDRKMPEEINRILTDAISDFLFITEKAAEKNLSHEGVLSEKIFFVGNVMIDSLKFCLSKIKEMPLPFAGIEEGKYAVITLHRPSNVDDPELLKSILTALRKISFQIKLVIPLHPRTMENIKAFNLTDELKKISANAIIAGPIGYIEMLRLNNSAKMIITDSGGLQEEATYLGIPCITLRKNTERPSTVDLGTNVIVGNDMNLLQFHFEKIMANDFKKGQIPPLWDGNTAGRIVEILEHKNELPCCRADGVSCI
jgi:UDP-N-acetylglucosamine 2-epimerase (non-hydrolysing)